MNVLSLVNTKMTHILAAAAASGSDTYFQNVATNVKNTLATVSKFIYIAVAVAIVGVGVLCIFGSERSKEMAKSKFVSIVIGAGLVVLAVVIAEGVVGMFTTTPA